MRPRRAPHAPLLPRASRVAASAPARAGLCDLLPDPARADRDGELLGLHRILAGPGVHAAQLFGNVRGLLRQAARTLRHAEDLSLDTEVLPLGLADRARRRILHRLLPRVPCAHHNDAGHAFSRVHRAVLDLERHPHDLVDSAARPQWPDQYRAGQGAHHRDADRVADLLRLLGDRRAGAPLHAVHDRSDLQLDDADRPRADRGRA